MRIWLWIPIAAAVVAAGATAWMLRRPDVEAIQRRRQGASLILADLEREMTEWGREKKKLEHETDALYRRDLALVARKEELKPVYQYLTSSIGIDNLETQLKGEIGRMEAEIQGWVGEHDSLLDELASIEKEMAKASPGRTKELEDIIGAKKRELEEVQTTILNARADIEKARAILEQG